MKKTLSALINPISTSSFLEHYNTNTPLAVHDLKHSISELIELPFLASPEALLAFWPKEVDVYLAGIADEVNSTRTAVDEAKKMFQNGKPLIFNDADTVSPILQKWTHNLASDLGLSNLTYGRSLLCMYK